MRSPTHSLCGLGTFAAIAACSGPEGVVGGPADERAQDSKTTASALSTDTLCTGAEGGVPYSKYKTAFFGNLHQHTGYSLDAYTFGTRASPDDAYLFAKQQTSIQVGAATSSGPGPTVTIDRPLDFLA